MTDCKWTLEKFKRLWFVMVKRRERRASALERDL